MRASSSTRHRERELLLLRNDRDLAGEVEAGSRRRAAGPGSGSRRGPARGPSRGAAGASSSPSCWARPDPVISPSAHLERRAGQAKRAAVAERRRARQTRAGARNCAEAGGGSRLTGFAGGGGSAGGRRRTARRRTPSPPRPGSSAGWITTTRASVSARTRKRRAGARGHRQEEPVVRADRQAHAVGHDEPDEPDRARLGDDHAGEERRARRRRCASRAPASTPSWRADSSPSASTFSARACA